MGTVRARRFNLRLLVVLAIIAIMATAAYGFAASNTVNPSHAGDGSGAISGYTVSKVHYTMDTINPANVSGVSFELDQPANTAQVRFGTGAGPFTWSGTYSCNPVTAAPDTQWTCPVNVNDHITVASITQLDVAAAD